MSALTFPAWRSLLYVPADRPTFVEQAAERGADAIILDLEDGVAPEHKEAARAGLHEAARFLRAQGATVLVRINRPWRLAWRDLEAAVAAEVAAILLPKVEDAGTLTVIDAFLTELEGDSGVPLPVIPLLESAKGIARAHDLLSASARIAAVVPGNEDVAADLGIEPHPDLLLYTHSSVILAAAAARVSLLGLIGSGANFRDLDAYRERAQLAKRWGFQGATCIHPAQIPILNEVFSPTADEVRWARDTVSAFEAAGSAPTQMEGQMIDRPVYLRARRLLQRADRIVGRPGDQG